MILSRAIEDTEQRQARAKGGQSHFPDRTRKLMQISLRQKVTLTPFQTPFHRGKPIAPRY